MMVVVRISLVVTVNCPSSTQHFRYVIVQSLDTFAEKLCIAEVCVNNSQYAIVAATVLHITIFIYLRQIVNSMYVMLTLSFSAK